MAAVADLFGDEVEEHDTVVRPLEPLHSMLLEMPSASLKYTLSTLQEFDNESALDDRFETVALSRRDYIKQVHLAMTLRGLK